jgi:lipoate-protein ligase A
MAARFRVIDTGLREGRANIAFDQALIDLHQTGDIPDTIRFLRFQPTALVGRHQAVAAEIKRDYCRDNGIGIGRRITGGGAIYFDEGQLGWELVFHRRTLGLSDLGETARVICEAAAAGLRTLGVDARFRPRNDIEVDGRKICGTGGFFDGETLFYQGTLLVDMDPSVMVGALNVPRAKLAKRNLDSAEARVVTLRALLGGDLPDFPAIQEALLGGLRDGLGIETEREAVRESEDSLAREIHDTEIGTDEFVYEIDDPAAGGDVRSASHTGPGGTVTVYLRVEGPRADRVREVLITGDFFVAPPRLIYDLEAVLRGRPVADIGAAAEAFFDAADARMLSIGPADFRAALESAARGGSG